MEMASSGAGATGSLPKWQLALVVGAPVALGLGYMYYRSGGLGGSTADKPSGGRSRRGARENGGGEKQISIDGECKAKAPRADETPLEKAQRYKAEGNKFFNTGKFDEAIAQYNIAIDSCPKENIDELATFYQNRAAAYEKLKKYSSVRADCTKALELKPKYVKALIRRARAMESINELETALEDITAACILEKFRNENTLFIADKVLKQLGKQHAQEFMATKKPIMPSKHFISTYFMAFHNDPIIVKTRQAADVEDNTPFAKALEAVRDQRYDEVIPLCTQELNDLAKAATATATAPSSATNGQSGGGDDDDDDESFGDGVEKIIVESDEKGGIVESSINGSDSKRKSLLLLFRGTFYLLLGQHELAMADLSEVIDGRAAADSAGVKVNALIKRASMYIQLEQPDKSFVDFEEAVRLDPDCGDIYHNRGQVHLLMEKVDEAKADFEKAVELNPGFGVAFVQKCYADYRYAYSKRDMNLINDAMTNFNKAFEKFPDCSECYTLYAQMLVDYQDFVKADAYFIKASKRDPKNATVLVYRGLLQLQWQKNVDKAVELMREAIELDEKCEFAYETLGTVEVQRGNLKDAISLFDKALALGRTSMELTHIFSLRDAAKAQLNVAQRLGADVIKSIQQMSMQEMF